MSLLSKSDQYASETSDQSLSKAKKAIVISLFLFGSVAALGMLNSSGAKAEEPTLNEKDTTQLDSMNTGDMFGMAAGELDPFGIGDTGYHMDDMV